MVVGAVLKRRAAGEIGAREVYIRQCSVKGGYACRREHGILPELVAFLTTITASTMHDRNRSSSVDDS